MSLAMFEGAPTPDGHVAQHALARLQVGELTGEDADAVRQHLDGCPACRERLAGLERASAAFLAQHPPHLFGAALAERRARWSPSAWMARMFRPVGAVAVAAAAAVVLLIVIPDDGPQPRTTTRLKAGVSLSFHVKSGSEISMGLPGAAYHPGDSLQLRYTTPAHRHLLVVSLDGHGAVTAFYERWGRSLSIEPGVAQLLQTSVVLDDAVGPERIIGCFSHAPLRTSQALEAGRRALAAAGGDPRAVESLDLPCDQTSFLIEKRPLGPRERPEKD